ncbi:uncharacterized protein LOC106168893 [Lingula anatina]|uniref:Uncharacterized protein LOC106168893 n=1 Tax=Lingula anatina TaxID=7574 RepID=A0A1S3IZH9_LINAN|nr:uncharacterized protein LOC106168893 [Lingula anatina]|eukprot:XP_013403602.1 uncharacterized protein LOC106168893 [Lingula anatina]
MARSVELQNALLPVTQPLSIDCDGEDVFTMLGLFSWEMDGVESCLLSPTDLISGTPAPSPVTGPQDLWGGEGHVSSEDFDLMLMQHCFPALEPWVDRNNNDINAGEGSIASPSTQGSSGDREEMPLDTKRDKQSCMPTVNSRKRAKVTSVCGGTKRRRTDPTKKIDRRVSVSALRNQLLFGLELTSGCHVMQMEPFLRI